MKNGEKNIVEEEKNPRKRDDVCPSSLFETKMQRKAKHSMRS
jgi:hypothetical protein